MKKILTFLVLASVLLTPSFAWLGTYDSRYSIVNETYQIVSSVNGPNFIDGEALVYGPALGDVSEQMYFYFNDGFSSIAVGNDTTAYCSYQTRPTILKDCASFPDPNLDAHWPMDDSVVNNTWDPVGGYNGTTMAASLFSNASGMIGYAYDMDTSGNIETSYSRAVNSNETHTIMFWLKTGSSASMRTINNHFTGGSRTEIRVNQFTAGKVSWAGNHIGNWHEYTGQTSVTDDVWHHIAIVFHGTGDAISGASTVTFYVDGSADTTQIIREEGGTWTELYTAGVWTLAGVIKGPNAGNFNGSLDDIRIFSDELTSTEIQEYYNSSRFTYLSNLQSRTLFITTDPETPHVEENVTMVANNVEGFTAFYWDYGDSVTEQTTNNVTYHTYFSGGVFNISVLGTNSSGVNVSAFFLLTVTDPEVTIWAQEIVSGNFITNFGITISNETASFNRSTAGAFVLWDYTDGPKGNVNVTVFKSGFNHTTESFYISNSSNTNFTASVETALISISPRDVNYFTLPVPAVVEVRNETVVATSVAAWETFSTFDINYGGAASQNNCSALTNVGQMFQYIISCDIDDAHGGFARSRIYIYDDAGGNQVEVDLAECNPSPDSETENRVFYLSKDGTYKILETDGTAHDTGSFAFFPAKAQICSDITRSSGGGPGYETDQTLFTIKNQYDFFLGTGTTPIGDIEVTLSQDTAGTFGFLQNTYTDLFFGLQNVMETSKYNITGFMIPTSDSIEVKFTVVDRSEDAIEDAFIQAFINLNGTLTIGTSGFTDGTGILKLNLKNDGIYQLIVSADPFEPRSISVRNPESEYKFYMETTFEFFTSPLSGLLVSLEPTDTNLNRGESTSFNLTVVDSQANLSYWGLTIFDQNQSVISSQRDYTPTGGFMSFAYIPVNESYIFANMTFKRIGDDEFNLTRQYTVWNFTTNQTSFTSFIPDLRLEMGPKAWSILIIFITLILAALSPWFAVLGLFALSIANGINIFVAIAALMVALALLLRGLG